MQFEPIAPMPQQPLTPEEFKMDLTSPDASGDWPRIAEAFNRHGLLLWRDQQLSPTQLVSWSRRFGPLRIDSDTLYLLPDHPEVIVIGNLVVDGVMKSLFVNGAEEWHFDGSYLADPSIGSLFHAIEVPSEGGDTLFADTHAAHEALDEDTKRFIENRMAVHSWEVLHDRLTRQDPTRPPLTDAERRLLPPVKHPLVQRHPATGKKNLRVCADSISEIEGLSEADGAALVARLLEHATQPRFVYRHRWRKGDLIAYDNRSLLHTATVFDTAKHLRVMHRTTILGAAGTSS
jgi:taurine dioxygenase